MKKEKIANLLLIAQFIIVIAGVFGSLFFSEIMKFPPCNLCWYQRICLYPMVFIIMTGLFLDSKETAKFLLPFSVTGLLISAYHNLVYFKFITVIVPCTESAPCTAEQLNWLGFITIPLLSLFSFAVLLFLNLLLISLFKIEGQNEK